MEIPCVFQCVECDEKLLSELRTAEEIYEDINKEDLSKQDDENEGNVSAVFRSKCRSKYIKELWSIKVIIPKIA